jgi:integrase
MGDHRRTNRQRQARTRRAPGRSSIFKDRHGRWQGFVSMGKRTDGRRDRRHVRGRTRQEILEKIRALEQRRDDGLPALHGRVPTVGEWLCFWLDHIAVHRLRPRTWEGYWSRARAWILPGLGELRLDRLCPVRAGGGLLWPDAGGGPGALQRPACPLHALGGAQGRGPPRPARQ